MTWTITIDPVELMDTAVLLGTSAVELTDIGSTLRSCTSCAMPPEVRNSVDAIVATTDLVLDEMAAQLRSEAANLAQRAIIAANDMLTAAGYPPLPGTTTTPNPGPTITPDVAVIGGTSWSDFTIIQPDGTPYVAPNSMTIGGNRWGTSVIVPTSGSSPSAHDHLTGLGVVGGSWTPSSLEITVTNPDGTPSGYSVERLSAMLSQSARIPPSHQPIDPIDRMATAWAMQPITHMMQNDFAYNQWASGQNMMGITPPPQHQSTYRSGP